MIEFLWLLSGLVGATLIWWQFKRIGRYSSDFTWCPSPLGIVFALASSVAGPFLLLLSIGAFLTIIFFLEDLDYSKCWLTRPICRKPSAVSQKCEQP